MKNNKNGFTLIELLAVIVILAILAGITAIMVTNYIENSKINADRLNAQNITNAVLREWQVQGNESNREVYVFADNDSSKVNSADLLEKPLENSPWTDNGYETVRAVIDEDGNVRVCLYDGTAKKGVIGDYQEIAADEDLKAKEEDGEIIETVGGKEVIRLKYRNITTCPDEFYPKAPETENPTPGN